MPGTSEWTRVEGRGQAIEQGRQAGLAQAAAHLRSEAQRHRTRDASHMTTAQRERMINYLLRLARTVESLE